jgi:hypothetical protein
VLAEQSPAQAAVLLRVRQRRRAEHNDIGADFSGIGERLTHCRAELLERLGPDGWEASLLAADTMALKDAIEGALPYLRPAGG